MELREVQGGEPMSSIGKMGGYSSSGKWRNLTMSRRGLKALTAVGAEEQARVVVQAFEMTDSLRKLGERYLKEGKDREAKEAFFELEKETGEISLKIFDPNSGEVRLKLTPEEVAKGLKMLEETEDNLAPLSSFFVDVTV